MTGAAPAPESFQAAVKLMYKDVTVATGRPRRAD